MSEIRVGQIWQVVTDDFWSSEKSDRKYIDHNQEHKIARKMRIRYQRDEYLEIRYPFAWHFRTVDNIYMHAEPSEILKHCRYIGEIDENIKFGNRHRLAEILEQKLYKAVWEVEA
jgi:hypothetical protein